MRKRVTYRPSKASGVLSGVMGAIFVLIGIFGAVPIFGAFGILWTLAAVAITIANLYQAFGKEYVGPKIDIEDVESMPVSDREDQIPATGSSVQSRLEQLESLKAAGLLTKQEYEDKRQAILKDL